MDTTFIYLVLLFLVVATVINTIFIIRAAKMIEAIAPSIGMPAFLSEGAPLPKFSGRMIETGELVSNRSIAGKPGVIIFMAPECTACEEKKPEVLRAKQGAEKFNLNFFVTEPDLKHSTRKGLNDNPLSSLMISLDRKSFDRLNPTKSMPLYIFYDDIGAVKASNLVGDENWALFVQQVTVNTPSPGQSQTDPQAHRDRAIAGTSSRRDWRG